MMLNRYCEVVVQLVNFLLGSLAASHAGGRADIRNGKSRPLHIYLRNLNRKIQFFFRLYKSKMMLNRHYGVVVQLINFLLGSLAACHDSYFMGNGRADALVVKLAMASPVRSHSFKKTESKDSVFFRLYKSKMMLNRHYGVVVQLINFLLGTLAACHDSYFMGNGRTDALVVMLAMTSSVRFSFIYLRSLN